MTAPQLTRYLLTQTNVIAAVETGRAPLPDVAEWITAGVTPYFAGGARAMRFSGTIWYLRRSDAA